MGTLRVAVIGGGMVGLLSAEQVVKSYPDAEVTIIADKLLTDTTSDGAAGLFMPVLYGFRASTEELTRIIMKDSYEYYTGFVNKKFGVTEVTGIVLSDTTEEKSKCAVMSNILPNYRKATEEELLEYTGAWRYGSCMDSLVMKGRSFMPILLEWLKQNGVKVKERHVYKLFELEDIFDVVINCSGLGAKYLCNDDYVIPIRGQIIKARTPGVDKFILGGEASYIIPHGYGISTLGGTNQFGYTSLSVSSDDTNTILKRCTSMVPTLKNLQVLWEWVGLRPYRHCVRIEGERIGKLKVIHNYGHGGSGITTAPGTAKHAVLIMEQMLKFSKL